MSGPIRPAGKPCGWNPPAEQVIYRRSDDADIDAILFTGDNVVVLEEFSGGRILYVRPGALLLDTDDRALVVRVGDWIVRWPGGAVTRLRCGARTAEALRDFMRDSPLTGRQSCG